MASPSEGKLLEFRVGLFMVIGLAVIGYMVVMFGRVGTGIRQSYPLIVELPNASGLLKNSKVLLSGATVGVVTDSPQVLDHARGVSVEMKIFQPIQIPRNAKIVVGSSGLLGDRFVDVLTQRDDQGGYYAPGEIVHGSREAGMDDLTRDGGELVTELRAAVANINGVITRVDHDLLKPEMFANLQQSVANLNATTKNFQTASEKINGVLDEARGAVADARKAIEQVHGVIDGAKETVATANGAAGDVRKAVGDARKVLASAQTLTDQAVHGNGLLGTLITNRELADNLAALVSNLRRTGIVFYKDRPAPASRDAAEVAPNGSPAAAGTSKARH